MVIKVRCWMFDGIEQKSGSMQLSFLSCLLNGSLSLLVFIDWNPGVLNEKCM